MIMSRDPDRRVPLWGTDGIEFTCPICHGTSIESSHEGLCIPCWDKAVARLARRQKPKLIQLELPHMPPEQP